MSGNGEQSGNQDKPADLNKNRAANFRHHVNLPTTLVQRKH